MAKLEEDPRFRVLSAAWSKFLNAAEGQLLMTFMEIDRPRTNISSGTEIASTTGAYSQGYDDCIDRLKRLSVFITPPPSQPQPDMLKSDRIEGSPYNPPLPE